jgi:N6-L-threonylcarbamoyladenine synthase
LVGTAFTHALAFAQNKPLIPIHHLEGHLASVFLNENTSEHPDFPFIALLVSGGHSQLYRVNAPCDYALLGDTLDDAAGEAFDKSAKLLGLPYPGGAMLSALAQQGEASFNLPRPMLHSGDLNFSFSGLKTAVLNCVQKEQLITPVLSAQTKANVARSFVEAVVEVLVSKSKQALKTHQLKQLVVVGGVSANIQLREGLQHMLAKQKGQVFFPALKWCTDNAAMIAQAAAWRYQHLLDQQQDLPTAGNFSVRPRWNLNDQ